MKGFIEIDFIPERNDMKHSGIPKGILKLSDVVETSGDLLVVGENDLYLHCFFVDTGQYYGIFKSEDKNHIYQHVLRFNQHNSIGEDDADYPTVNVGTKGHIDHGAAISAEQLKKVAEYMGYIPRFTELGEPVLASGELCLKYTLVRYNPLKNSDQCLELMEKLKIDVYRNKKDTWQAGVGYYVEAAIGEGKTINEAVTLAAIAYVEHNSIGGE